MTLMKSLIDFRLVRSGIFAGRLFGVRDNMGTSMGRGRMRIMFGVNTRRIHIERRSCRWHKRRFVSGWTGIGKEWRAGGEGASSVDSVCAILSNSLHEYCMVLEWRRAIGTGVSTNSAEEKRWVLPHPVLDSASHLASFWNLSICNNRNLNYREELYLD